MVQDRKNIFQEEKKTKKTGLIALLLACICLCGILASCGAAKDDVVGVWNSTYTYEGNDFDVTLTINADGRFEKVMLKNDSPFKTEVGDWKIDNGVLKCYDDSSDGSWMEYTMSLGSLKNGDHLFKKVK